MKKDYKAFIEEQLALIQNTDFLKSNDLPNIDLYMDQVTTYMDDNLGLLTRNNEGKTLTKTMINNYSKAGILPPSNKKKYSKEHMLMLILIYNMKHVMTIPDIHEVLKPLQQLDSDNHAFETFFDTMMEASKKHFQLLSEDILKTMNISETLFDYDDEDDTLGIVSTIYLLSMQAAVHKYLATSLIDTYLTNSEENKTEKK